jgi:hypothetical protein
VDRSQADQYYEEQTKVERQNHKWQAVILIQGTYARRAAHARIICITLLYQLPLAHTNELNDTTVVVHAICNVLSAERLLR